MEITRLFKQFVLIVALLTGAGLAQADDDTVCSPFRDGVVDESLLASMLHAAHSGHLYRIQQESSQVGFCVDSKLKRVKGKFREFRGGMNLTPTGDSGNGNGNGQTMILIKAGSLETEGAIIDGMLKSQKFFNVEAHPEILFVSNDFYWTGPETAVLKGNLTIRGITKPVVFSVTLTPLADTEADQAEKILVKATTTIDRTVFGMDGLASMVNNSVNLCMSVEALKYDA